MVPMTPPQPNTSDECRPAEAAQEKALATIRDHRVWTLNAEQSLTFAQAILDPPEPTASQRAVAEIVPVSGTSDDRIHPPALASFNSTER